MVLCLVAELVALAGTQQFIWGEKPTGPLGILQLLACVKQVGRWSGTAFLDVLSHKVPCFAGRKTAHQKGLFHEVQTVSWSLQCSIKYELNFKNGNELCKAA